MDEMRAGGVEEAVEKLKESCDLQKFIASDALFATTHSQDFTSYDHRKSSTSCRLKSNICTLFML